MVEIPKEHQIKCEGCGEILDMRDPSVVMHGWIENGISVCYDDDLKPIPYNTSKKVGEPVEWTSDKKPIHLS